MKYYIVEQPNGRALFRIKEQAREYYDMVSREFPDIPWVKKIEDIDFNHSKATSIPNETAKF